MPLVLLRGLDIGVRNFQLYATSFKLSRCQDQEVLVARAPESWLLKLESSLKSVALQDHSIVTTVHNVPTILRSTSVANVLLVLCTASRSLAVL